MSSSAWLDSFSISFLLDFVLGMMLKDQDAKGRQALFDQLDAAPDPIAEVTRGNKSISTARRERVANNLAAMARITGK